MHGKFGQGFSVLVKMAKNRSSLIGLVGTGVLLFVAMFAPMLAPYSPTQIDISNQFSGCTWAHPLGTDSLGRDTLSRIFYGSRLALMIAVPTVILAFVVGTIVGTLAGYFPRLDNVILPVLDIIKSFPAIMFAITVMALFGASVTKLILIIAILWFPIYARVMRAQVRTMRQRDYVAGAEAIGASTLRILVRHIVPNSTGPLLILIAMDIPAVIAVEAALSFLGLGIPPPAPSWGRMLSTGYAFMRFSPWLVVFTGAALAWATLSFTLLGEGLRDNLDPKMGRGR